MSKLTWKPGTMLYPVPAVMVSCRHNNIDNIITIAWAGTICTDPAMVSISIRKNRYSYDLIKESGEFVINMPGESMAFGADFCGVRSGRDIDKFTHLNLTKVQGTKVNVPMIKECPVNIECKLKEIIELGSHDMFLAEVIAVNVDESLMDENDKLNLDRANLICYSHGEYCLVSKPIGKFGYSVKKPPKKGKKK
ncbi:MAG: flavin reductase family protein [Clostridium sp.]|uniref:flavin reductase family protein n=1 Tax=Clostridium sp. TaxID=1506 RepID=UPI002FC61289